MNRIFQNIEEVLIIRKLKINPNQIYRVYTENMDVKGYTVRFWDKKTLYGKNIIVIESRIYKLVYQNFFLVPLVSLVSLYLTKTLDISNKQLFSNNFFNFRKISKNKLFLNTVCVWMLIAKPVGVVSIWSMVRWKPWT